MSLVVSRDTPPEASASGSLMRGVRWLTAATVLLSLLNYAYSISLTHLLPVADFAVFAAGQALLLTAGTVSSASVPWVIAQALSGGAGPHVRRQVIWFGVLANAVLGLLAAVLLAVLASRFAPVTTALVLGGSAFLVFLSSSTVGLLQADRRFGALGGLRVAETVLKVAAGLTLVALGTGAMGAIAGFAAGSTLLVAAGIVYGRREIRPTPGALRLRSLWRSAAGVGSVQALVSVLSAADLVLVALLVPADQAAVYQAAMILSRVPMFIAGAVGVSAFPLVAADASTAAPLLRQTSRVYLVLVLPYAVALATAPVQLRRLLFPAAYDDMGMLLHLTAVSGVLLGGVALLTTFFQADRRYRSSVTVQLLGVGVHVVAVVVGGLTAQVAGLAAGAVLGTAVSVVALLVVAPPAWRAAARPPVRLLLLCAGLAGVLASLVGVPWLWLAVAAAAGGLAAAAGLGLTPRLPAGLRPRRGGVRR